jgi:CheY-like chemotaxis protein
MAVTILAVDDSATMRSILELSFAGEDAKVVAVATADAALSKVGDLRPDVVLLDNSLPGTTSYELCQKIKQAAPQARALVLASEHHPYDETKGRQSGVDGSVSKPFETQILIERVNELVSRRGIEPTSAAPARAVAAPAAPSSPSGGIDPAAAARMRQKTVMGTGTAMPAVPPVQPKPSFRRAEPAPAAARPQAAPQPQQPPMARQGERFTLGTAATQEQPVSYPPAAIVSSDLSKKLTAMGLTREQVEGVLALSREVIEQVVWEVVPELAETLIKEEIQRLTAK